MNRQLLSRMALIVPWLLIWGSPGCGSGGTNSSNDGSAVAAQSASHGGGSGGDGSSMSADDRAARDFVQGRIDEHWLKTADGWTTQLQVRNGFGQPIPGNPEVLYRQYRDLKFFVHPESVTESQKLNGADYRAGVEFKNTPVRHYRLQATIVDRQGWSAWEDGSPGWGVAVERRNGKWLITDDELFRDLKPDQASVPK